MLYYLFFIFPILRFSSAFYVKFLELIEYGGNYWMSKHASREGYQCMKSLEEAQQTVFQMEEKLSLKGATIAFAEAQQQVNDASSEEGIQLATGLSDTTSSEMASSSI
nr:kinesin-like protein KIN-12C isoform X1 [Ipomoea batatas]GME16435.1 kinesin-like protein KIN-12C isoform X1 [Ipomoea batatas]